MELFLSKLVTSWVIYQRDSKTKIIMYTQRRIQSNILSDKRKFKYLREMSQIIKVQKMKMRIKKERNQNQKTSRER